jgi:uncharacterized protein YceH (UPF0502 family)
MDIMLNETEVRILGCLIEKELTTPEYYPLSLNSLTNACNQKSNRNPITSYDENLVSAGLESLEEKGLARKTLAAGSRVLKCLHTVLDKFDLSRQEIALLGELLLRGPQTLGELRTRAERMSSFRGVEEVERNLQLLLDYDPPLALKLPRETGRKECRYMHLFSGNLSSERTSSVKSTEDRISMLEEETSGLRSELDELKQAFAEFKSQF